MIHESDSNSSKYWLDEDGCWLFGKHKKRPFFETPSEYLTWALSTGSVHPTDEAILMTYCQREGIELL